jgi:DNA-binding MarR family transcriptional regulator
MVEILGRDPSAFEGGNERGLSVRGLVRSEDDGRVADVITISYYTIMSKRPLRLIPPVHRATHRLGLYLASRQAEALSQGESHILALLAHAKPLTVGNLHEGLAHKRSTLTSILDRLEARRVITRAVGQTDRRTFVVTLTAKGRRLANQVFDQMVELERAVAAQVSAGDLAGFSRVLTAIETEAHARAAAARKRHTRS